jgi:hypothetical protein
MWGPCWSCGGARLLVLVPSSRRKHYKLDIIFYFIYHKKSSHKNKKKNKNINRKNRTGSSRGGNVVMVSPATENDWKSTTSPTSSIPIFDTRHANEGGGANPRTEVVQKYIFDFIPNLFSSFPLILHINLLSSPGDGLEPPHSSNYLILPHIYI